MVHATAVSKICLSFFLLISPAFIHAQDLNDYYASVQGLSGEALKTALYDIIKGHTEFPYTAPGIDVWDILKETDRDTANPENVILFYSGWSVNAAQEYNDGNGWTREQIWAISHGDFDTGRGVGTDVHHLRPVDLSVNSARNNKDFDWGGSMYIDGDGPTECFSDADSWEPRDAVKGDVARMLFYMAIRYEGENGEPDLVLIDDINTSELTVPGKGFHGKLSTLLEWHESDPVDSFEIKRNEIIFSYQKNRNPFIDLPELAKKIWTITSIDAIKLMPVSIFPNPAKSFINIESLEGQLCEAVLLSMEGKALLSGKIRGNIKWHVGDFPDGLYFIRLVLHNNTYTEKLIIKK